MRLVVCLLLVIAFTGSLPAGTISMAVSAVGTDNSGAELYRYTYTLSNFPILSTNEINLRFDPAKFRVLSNPVASAAFHVLIMQPNNPPGAPGDYSLLPKADFPSIVGPFSVDFTIVGNEIPAVVPYFINQYRHEEGAIIFERVLEFGIAEVNLLGGSQPQPAEQPGQSDPHSMPEPATLGSVVAALTGLYVARTTTRCRKGGQY